MFFNIFSVDLGASIFNLSALKFVKFFQECFEFHKINVLKFALSIENQ